MRMTILTVWTVFGLVSSASAAGIQLGPRGIARLKKAQSKPGQKIPVGAPEKGKSMVFLQSTFFTARPGRGFLFEANPLGKKIVVRTTMVDEAGKVRFQLLWQRDHQRIYRGEHVVV